MKHMNKLLVSKGSLKSIVLKYSAYLIFLFLIIISSILSPVFLSVENIFNVLRQQAPTAIIAIGGLLVILTGGIDLSVGALLGVCNIFIAIMLSKWNMGSVGGVFLAMLLTIIIGLLMGSLNGVLVSKFKMAPFIATLAVMTMVRGLAYQLTGGSPIRLPVDPVKQPGSAGLVNFGQIGDPIFGMPLAVWSVILITLVFWFIMKYTSFGRLIIASGSNETAVRLAGINVNKYKFSVYAISGILAGMSAILITARAGIATPTAGTGFELDAIAACVIGGASLAGGKGKVMNTIIGVLIIALIGNIMNLLSVPAYPQQMIKGAIIILAVLMNGIEDKK